MDPKKVNIEKAGIVGDNVTLKGTFVSGGEMQVNIDKYVQKEKEIPKYITQFPPKPLHLIGREQELVTLTKLIESNSYLHVEGIPGVGKTALVQTWLHQNQKDFDHIIWIKGGNQLAKSLLQQIDPFDIGIKLNQNQDLENRFLTVLHGLRNIKGQNILIFDHFNNASEILGLKDFLSFPPNWTLVLTTRTHSENVPILPLDGLEIKQANQLFKIHYPEEINASELGSLLAKIDYNPLIIELFAKVLHANVTLNGIEGLRQLTEKNLDDKTFQVDVNVHQSDIEVRLFDHLMSAFRLSDLGNNEAALKILRRFCLIPEGHFNGQDLANLFDIPKNEQTEFSNVMNRLVNLGWLENPDKKDYGLNPVIRKMLLYQIQPKGEEVHSMIDKLVKQTYLKTADPMSLLIFLPFFEVLRPFIKKSVAEPIKSAEYYNAYGLVTRLIGQYRFSLEMTKKAMVLMEPIVASQIREANNNNEQPEDAFTRDRILLAKIYNNIGMYYEQLGDINQAVAYQAKGIDLLNDAPPEFEFLQSIFLDNASTNFLQIGTKESLINAEANIHRSIAIKEKYEKDTGFYLGLAYNNLGQILYLKKIYDKALDATRKSIELLSKNVVKDHPQMLVVLNNEILIKSAMGQHTDVIDSMKILIERMENALGPNHPDVSLGYLNLGSYYASAKKSEDASRQFEKVMSILEEKQYDTSFNKLKAMDNLAYIHLEKKEFSKSAQLWERVVNAKEQKFGVISESTALSYNNLGYAYFCLKDLEKAKVSYEKALKIYHDLKTEGNSTLAMLYSNKAVLLNELGDYTNASLWAKAAVNEGSKVFPKNHPRQRSFRILLNKVQRNKDWEIIKKNFSFRNLVVMIWRWLTKWFRKS